jgi:ATP-dependent exoDNAse (exonuclease V) alpha subunit
VAKHLSVRLPWHDRGWDGHVCDRPSANVYCTGEYGLKAHGIREGKDDSHEEAVRSKPCASLRSGEYRPPCLRTIQTFGGTSLLSYQHEPKAFLSTSANPVRSIDDTIEPCTVGTWAYDQVFRREEAEDEVQAEFVDRYSPEEAQRNIADFFGDLAAPSSLVFFYLNYDNPLNSERRRYVLVGAAEIDAVSPQHEWEGMEQTRADRYGVLVWNRFITHGFGQGRGCRIPYERYLNAGKDFESVLIEIPDDMSRHFKYVCRSFSDDEATILLQYLADALERGRKDAAIEWDWSAQLSWVSTALDRAWKNRGLFPGIAAALETLGFQQAALYVRAEIVGKGVQDPRGHVLERVGTPQSETDDRWRRQFENCRHALRALPEAVKTLLFDRLALMDLTSQQMSRICGSDLVPPEERRSAGLSFTASEVIENPYLIIEQYAPADDDPIPFYRIDNGIFLPQTRGGASIPGIDEFASNDRRRIRSAIFNRLREARLRGHSFLPQGEVIQFLQELQLPGVRMPLGLLTLAVDLDFFEEGLRVVKDGDHVGWMLPIQKHDEDEIRNRIAKLRGRKRLNWVAVDWPTLLPSAAGLPDAVAKQARDGHVAALDSLATQPFSVLVGGAGTGKTTVVATFIKALQSSPKPAKLLLLAPTGKAAVRLKKRIKDVAGHDLEPLTIHGYLVRNKWMDPATFRLRRDGTSVVDGTTTVVIDESSMLDVPMLATVFRALDWTKVERLILCGDEQQLPPIGVGAPFKNIVDRLRADSGGVAELIVNVRQIREGSVALQVAQQFSASAERMAGDELLDRLRAGGALGEDLQLWFFTDEHDLRRQLPKLAHTCVKELLAENGADSKTLEFGAAFDALHGIGRKDGVPKLDAFQILSPYRAGYFGVDELNRQIQLLLRSELLQQWRETLGKVSGRRYVRNDKVLQTQNKRLSERERKAWDRLTKSNVDLFVANGELGLVYQIDEFKKTRLARVSFETSPNVSVTVDSGWAEEWLDLGYAMTVHKAQGSDFYGVLLVIPAEERQLLLSRELLYTALTRFTRKLYLLVQGSPGDIAVLERGAWQGSSEYFRRNTSLYGLREAVKEIDDYRPEHRIHTTLLRELVASKSELLIANRLAELHVPYHYELKLVAADGSIRRPDFTVPIETPDGPDVRYWEHWGMLGNPDYDASVTRRLAWYEKHGLMSKLIQSDERGGFDSTKVDAMIREHLLP